MKIIHHNLKKGEIKLKAENQDDLWYLANIIEEGDLISGQTERKIKIGSDESVKTVRKTIFLKIKLEKTDFDGTTLRLLGTITEGPDDIPHGTHHSFSVAENDIIKIEKEKWLKYQLDKLSEAVESKAQKIIICIMDREDAIFAISKRESYEILSEISGEVEKKDIQTQIKKSFYGEIIKLLEDYDKRYNAANIVIASPSFWKEDLLKELKNDSIKKKIVLATCSSVTKSALNEIMKRGELKQVMKEDRAASEANLVEELLSEISKNDLAAYGLKETEEAVNSGAVKVLLITDAKIKESREKRIYYKIEGIMKTSETMRAEVHIINSVNEAGKKLDGLGGIAAILRYKTNY